jgi:hypothetical protein
MPTERLEGVGPYTARAVAEFRNVLASARRLLGQECVLGFAVPHGIVIEVWG